MGSLEGIGNRRYDDYWLLNEYVLSNGRCFY